jgi:hypothetical protein
LSEIFQKQQKNPVTIMAENTLPNGQAQCDVTLRTFAYKLLLMFKAKVMMIFYE